MCHGHSVGVANFCLAAWKRMAAYLVAMATGIIMLSCVLLALEGMVAVLPYVFVDL